MRDVVTAAVFVVMLVMALTRPWVGILLWTWVSFMNPHRLCYGFMASVPMALIGGSVTLFSFAAFQSPKRMIWKLETIVFLVLIFWFTVTTFLALNPADAWLYWEQVVKIDLMVMVTLMAMQEDWQIRSLVWAIVLSLGYFGFKGGIFTFVGGGDNRVWGPAGSFIADNNDLGVALAMTVPLIRYLAVSEKRRWVRAGLNVLCATTVLAILGTYSRAAFLALSAVGACLWWKSRRKFTTAVLLAAMAVLGAKTMPDAWFDRIRSIGDYKTDGSAQERFDSWHVAWRLAMDRPLIGGGFRAFTPELFRKYSEHPEFPFHEAHSAYMKVLAEHGFAGLALFVGLFAVTWQRAGKYAKLAARTPELGWLDELLRALQVSLIAYFVGGAFGPMCYFDLPYTLLAIVAVAGDYIRNYESESEDEVPDADEQISEEPLLQGADA